jgi:RNA polymerase sigma-70 factor (family 1)
LQHSGKDIHDYVASFKRGEEEGFTYFFKTLYPALLYYAFRIVNDRPAAEDVVGESFIKIWERHETFDHPLVIKSWLYTTVRNACLNKLQQEQRKINRDEAWAREQEGKYEQSVLNDIILAEVVSEVHATMEILPTECRKIFEMLYIDGKTVREVAEELGLSISTIKTQKARGLSVLRKRFPELSAVIPLEGFSSTLE